MSTVIAPDSLEWVTFSTEEDEPCASVSMHCPMQAVAVAIWKRGCLCSPGRQPLCARHRDSTIRKSAGSFIPGMFRCPACQAFWRLLRIEPLR